VGQEVTGFKRILAWFQQFFTQFTVLRDSSSQAVLAHSMAFLTVSLALLAVFTTALSLKFMEISMETNECDICYRLL
jgi:hypothetical protein